MSTRGAIARTTGDDAWVGRYHHFDSYPSGLGQTLYILYHTQFERDLPRMLHVLLDEHPAGWSTICGADWSQDAGFYEPYAHPCEACGRPSGDHWSDELSRTPGGNGNLALGHFFVYTRSWDAPRGAACYCHGDRAEGEQLIRSTDTDHWLEYAYVFNEAKRIMFIFDWDYDQKSWHLLQHVELDGPEPDWNILDAL